jgi:ribonucleoside-diphosphate reductase alpha chain
MEKPTSVQILSDITVHMKYARYLQEQSRRESWEELIKRNMDMHIKKYPQLEEEIRGIYRDFVYTKKVLPSMRSLQFAGKPIEISPSRIYNCAYLPVEDIHAFPEAMFLLLGGTGVGYSVQRHHVEKLPEIRKPNKSKERRFVVADSIEGWADAIKILFKSYFGVNNSVPRFDFSDIRPKGALLITSGGKAPGPQPLKECLVKIEGILDDKKDGEKLTTLEVHDIMCHIADAVLAGGIRRAALISLFSADDLDMMTCKSGAWWELNPQRGRANNSAVLLRHRVDYDTFSNIFEKLKASGSGEPGIYLTNDKDWGTNPCCEIALRPYQFCNLTEINASDIEDQEDFEQRCFAAAFIGTLQAGYSDFHYLRDTWKKNTEKDALLGVSMTGIASNAVFNCDIEAGVEIVKQTNKKVAEMIGINPAARLTAVKPAGTTSLVLGTSSGIHAWHSNYYIRRLRVGKNESIYSYLKIYHPELLEDDVMRPHDGAIISVPQKAPENASTREESLSELLYRIKEISLRWVKPGSLNGQNTHNVSATISVREGEWDYLKEWMWNNKEYYNGLSILPFSDHTYAQTPFEDITEEVYLEMEKHLHGIDLTKAVELSDNTNLMDQAACAGGACEVV